MLGLNFRFFRSCKLSACHWVAVVVAMAHKCVTN